MEVRNLMCKFGTPLAPFESDEIPTKKPINVEDEIVTDSNGKRRFHGAFTGGFSAGYWNTVSSAEGWTPQQFKSSRKEKASSKSQAISDFMDEEDIAEFGFAPQRVQTKSDFTDKNDSSTSNEKARQLSLFTERAESSSVSLNIFVAPTRDKASIRILKYMGWKEGKTSGASRSKKIKPVKTYNDKERYLIEKYGCEINSESSNQEKILNATELDDTLTSEDEDDVCIIEDNAVFSKISPKDNLYGVGYSGLNRKPIFTQTSSLLRARAIIDKKNNKLPIGGQAFGVGALEEEDEDIYARDDLTQYDSLLDGKRHKKNETMKAIEPADTGSTMEKFIESKIDKKKIKKVFTIELPDNFKPRNWLQRKTRFEPLNEDIADQLSSVDAHIKLGLGRHDLTSDDRKNILNKNIKDTGNDMRKNMLDLINQKGNSFVQGEILSNNLQDKNNFSKVLGDKEIMPTVNTEKSFQPINENPTLTRSLNKKDITKHNIIEFSSESDVVNQSETSFRNSFKALTDSFSDRFAAETKNPMLIENKVESVKKDVPINIIVEKSKWVPHKDLCIRFNIPEPFKGIPTEKKEKKKTFNTIFDALLKENNFSNFKAPDSKNLEIEDKPSPKEIERNVATNSSNIVSSSVTLPSKYQEITKKVHAIQPSSKPRNRVSLGKKSELEMQVLENITKRPEEKVQLYKLIFCSSDNVEENELKKKSPEKVEISVPSADPNLATAQQLNILRNNSAPTGVFKRLYDDRTRILFNKPAIEVKKAKKEEEITIEDEPQIQLYGPILPSHLNKQKDTTIAKPPNEIIMKFQTQNHGFSKEKSSNPQFPSKELPLNTSKLKHEDVAMKEYWVEKDNARSSKHKKEKKKKKSHKKNKKRSKKSR